MASLSGSTRTADVIVIGGGIIGCSIALRLAQASLKVIVLDRGQPGAEASSAAAGMLAPQGEMVEPPEFARLCLASRDLYPSFVAEIEQTSGRKVGYRSEGSLLVALDDEQARELRSTFREQTKRGFPLELLEPAEVHRRVRGLAPDLRLGLFVPGDHWVDNEALMVALPETCRRLGVDIYSGMEAIRLNVKDGQVESVEASVAAGSDGRSSSPSGGQRRPLEGSDRYSATKFVLAAGCWSPELATTLGVKLSMQPCRGQMLEFESLMEIPLVVRAGHHYIVPRANRRVLVGTTAEYVGFDKFVTGKGLHSILEGAGRLAPLVVKDLHFRRAWAGLRPDTADHLPILGYGELENLVFTTGHFRNGILLAPITAQLISELVLTGSTSLPISDYSPLRFAEKTPSAARTEKSG